MVFKLLLIPIVLQITSYCIFFIVGATSQCQWNAATPLPYHTVTKCLFAIPFNQKVAKQTVDAVRAYSKLFVFRDIIQDAPSPYNLSVNIDQRLDIINEKIAGGIYENDYFFQQDVQQIFIDIKDAHTMYFPGKCYSDLAFFLPFPLKSEMNSNGEQIIRVSSFEKHLEVITTNFSFLFPDKAEIPSKYYGWEVKKINDVNPIIYLNELGLRDLVYSIDPSIRFNNILKQFWYYRPTASSPIPRNESVVLILQNTISNDTKSISVPFYGITKYSSNDNIESICGYTSDKNATIKNHSFLQRIRDYLPGDSLEVSPFLRNFIASKQNSVYRSNITISKENDLKFEPNLSEEFLEELAPHTGKEFLNSIYEEDEYNKRYSVLYSSPTLNFIVYKRANSNIGVLRVATFMGKSGTHQKEYLDSMKAGIKAITDANIRKIIVDVRGNTGGIVCFGWMLARYLSPYAPRSPSPPSDFIYSKLREQRYCSNDITTSMTLGLAKTRDRLPKDWFRNGPSRTRGGITSKYSKETILSCQAILLPYLESNYEPKYQFEPSNIVILTDGTCGSTCGLFVQLFQYLRLGKVAVQGGLVNSTIDVASFKGATVELSTTWDQLQVCKVDPQLKPMFPSNAFMTWSSLEFYPWSPTVGAFETGKANTSIPLQFLQQEADFRIDSWDFSFKSDEVYEELILRIDKCMKWEYKISTQCEASFENAVVGNPCNYNSTQGYGTTFHENVCEVYQCRKNYYLNDEKTRCIPMPDPYDGLGILVEIIAIITAIALGIYIICCCGMITSITICCVVGTRIVTKR